MTSVDRPNMQHYVRLFIVLINVDVISVILKLCMKKILSSVKGDL